MLWATGSPLAPANAVLRKTNFAPKLVASPLVTALTLVLIAAFALIYLLGWSVWHEHALTIWFVLVLLMLAIGYTTRVKHLVSDLESHKAYFFCVSAIGTAGEGAQCPVAMGEAA